MKRETRRLLAVVRDAQDPTAADEARVLLALRATLAAGATTSAVASATLEAMRRARPGTTLGMPGSAWTLGSKWMLGGVCALAASFGTGDTSRSAPAVDARAPSAQAPVAPLAPPREAIDSGNDAPRAPVPLEQGRAAASPERLDAARRAAREASAPRASTPSAPRASTPSAPRASTPSAPRASTPSAPRASTPSAPRASTPSALRAELELLGRVQQLLREGNAAAALRALDAHHTDDRVLLAERRAARILALCGIGRTGQARAAAAEFEKEHPDSVQRAMLASSCANSRPSDAPRGVIEPETP
jgi:hypothetical protein